MTNLKELLDNNAEYRLTKVGCKDSPGTRMVQKGDIHLGETCMVNDRLIVGDLITSQVKSFSQNGENFVIETANSVYSLEKLVLNAV